jgi:hypothetical protein
MHWKPRGPGRKAMDHEFPAVDFPAHWEQVAMVTIALEAIVPESPMALFAPLLFAPTPPSLTRVSQLECVVL